MKFHNTAGHVYGARMVRAPVTPLLARLRRSRRFIVLMLLVFILRIGADVACTAHEILNAPADATAVEMSLDADGLDCGNPQESPFDVSGSCDHCGCHQVAAILPALLAADRFADVAPLAEPRGLVLPDLQSMELRPPIA